jgi:mRNA interferase MazF
MDAGPLFCHQYGPLITDQSSAKKRSVVVVSSDAYNRKRPDIIIMAVTSQMRSAAYFGDTDISAWQPAEKK